MLISIDDTRAQFKAWDFHVPVEETNASSPPAFMRSFPFIYQIAGILHVRKAVALLNHQSY
ncbi:MAG TPA: hypothetical protein VGO51_11530 [Burkholderiaceae bacterium]|nr:hypothetical protein [Burkholderiaceae bacterium]